MQRAKIFRFDIKTAGHTDVIDITDKVAAAVKDSKSPSGVAVVFVPSSTAAVTTMEFEPGLKKDVSDVLEKIAPYEKSWEHHKTWHDNNGAAHVRASIIGPSIIVPFENGRLVLGEWQQIVLMDFDTRAREHEVVVRILC